MKLSEQPTEITAKKSLILCMRLCTDKVKIFKNCSEIMAIISSSSPVNVPTRRVTRPSILHVPGVVVHPINLALARKKSWLRIQGIPPIQYFLWCEGQLGLLRVRECGGEKRLLLLLLLLRKVRVILHRLSRHLHGLLTTEQLRDDLPFDVLFEAVDFGFEAGHGCHYPLNMVSGQRASGWDGGRLAGRWGDLRRPRCRLRVDVH